MFFLDFRRSFNESNPIKIRLIIHIVLGNYNYYPYVRPFFCIATDTAAFKKLIGSPRSSSYGFDMELTVSMLIELDVDATDDSFSCSFWRFS